MGLFDKKNCDICGEKIGCWAGCYDKHLAIFIYDVMVRVTWMI